MKTWKQIVHRIVEIDVLYGNEADEGQQSERQTLCWVLGEHEGLSEDGYQKLAKKIAEEHGIELPDAF